MPRACFSPPGIPEYFRAVDYPRIYLKSKKDQSVRRFHPWVFSGAVKLMEGDPQPGDVVGRAGPVTLGDVQGPVSVVIDGIVD